MSNKTMLPERMQMMMVIGIVILIMGIFYLSSFINTSKDDGWVEGYVNSSEDGSFVTVEVESALGYFKNNHEDYIAFPIDINTIIEAQKTRKRTNDIQVGDKIRLYYVMKDTQMATSRIIIME